MRWGNGVGEMKRMAAQIRAANERTRTVERERDAAQLAVRSLTAVLDGIARMATRARPIPASFSDCALCISAYIDCPWHPTRTETT